MDGYSNVVFQIQHIVSIELVEDNESEVETITGSAYGVLGTPAKIKEKIQEALR